MIGAKHRQRNAFPIFARERQPECTQHRSDDQRSRRVRGRRKQPGNDHRSRESLRVSELHFDDSSEPHPEIRRQGASTQTLNIYSTSSFNGTFTFSSLNGLTDLNCHTPGDPTLPATTPCPVSYLYAQQQLQSGGVPMPRNCRSRPDFRTRLSTPTTPGSTCRTIGASTEHNFELRPAVRDPRLHP